MAAELNSKPDNAKGATPKGPKDIEVNLDFSLKILFGTDFGLKDLDLLETLNTGMFGRTRLVKSLQDKQYYALKMMKKGRIVKLQQLAHVQSEVTILSRLRCIFAVEMKALFQDENSVYLLLEYMPGGELYSHLRRSKVFELSLYQFYTVEVACALHYLHELKIVFRDLKPENILITKQGHIRLTDFTLAKQLVAPTAPLVGSAVNSDGANIAASGSVLQHATNNSALPATTQRNKQQHLEMQTFTLCGTPEYLAPEVIQGKGYGTSVDWWSLGILLYEMAVGYPPFYGRNPFTVYKKILECNIPLSDDKLPRATAAAITGFLTVARAQRMGCGSFDQLKAHAFFKGVDWNSARQQLIVPPVVPTVTSEGDTSNYDYYPEEGVEEASSNLTAEERNMFQAFDEILERPKQV